MTVEVYAINTLMRVAGEHLLRYPKMESADIIKLFYQGEFGAGHMIDDRASSLSGIAREMRDAKDMGAPMAESIGCGMGRLHIAPVRARFGDDAVAAAVVNALFVAGAYDAGDVRSLRAKLYAFADRAACGFSMAALPPWLSDARILLRDIRRYEAAGFPMARHSQAYRDAYAPAYRVVPDSYSRYMPLFLAVHRRISTAGRAVVAIDGRCGAGKSALAGLLAEVFGGGIIHMDDFFLPPDLRTEARLAEPGGNVHYERFSDEVIRPLLTGGIICHRVFDCGVMDYLPGERRVEPGPLLVVEGSYSMRPEMRAAYDITAFISAPEPVRLSRIEARNGKDALDSFRTLWIPMEEKYIKACGIAESCGFVFS